MPHEGTLQFRERLFNRIEIGAVRRQKPDVRIRGLDRGAHLRLLMYRQVIEDDDIPLARRRHQDLLDMREKRHAIDRAVKHGGRSQPVKAQASDDSVGVPVAAGCVIEQPRATGAAPIPAE